MKPLSFPMKLALRRLYARYQEAGPGWELLPDADLDGRSLTALSKRGLVEIDHWWRVRLTDAGRAAAAELKGDGNG